MIRGLAGLEQIRLKISSVDSLFTSWSTSFSMMNRGARSAFHKNNQENEFLIKKNKTLCTSRAHKQRGLFQIWTCDDTVLLEINRLLYKALWEKRSYCLLCWDELVQSGQDLTTYRTYNCRYRILPGSLIRGLERQIWLL